MSIASMDRIDKTIVLRAPRARVWRALTNVQEFGTWFGVALTGTFAPGVRVTGRITHPGYEHVPFAITVERLEPERLLSWRWHPNPIDQSVDYASEPTTLVTFELIDVASGTRLTVAETGFEAIPLSRLAAAYRGNEDGWVQQLRALAGYVSGAA